MNRVIKFRAWCNVAKRFLAPHECQGMSWKNGDNPDGMYDIGDYGHEMYAFSITWQQFTNLHDKNGKEIYEGDVIIDHLGRRRIICWLDFDATFASVNIDEYNKWRDVKTILNSPVDVDFMSDVSNKCEIIGNIYQHPELLTSKPVTHD